MPFVVTTPPALEPVTTTELKDYLRISDTSQDTLLAQLITAARDAVEKRTRRALIEQTVTATFRDWPDDEDDALILPVGNAGAVASVKYYDESNSQQTVNASLYFLVSATQPGRVYFKDAFTFPAVYDREDAVEIVFTAGYGDEAADVPQLLKIAVMALASYWFEQRLPVNVGNIVNEMPLHVQQMINSYRVIMTEP